MVGSEPLVLVLLHRGAGGETGVLADVVGSADAEEAAVDEVVGPVLVHRQRLDQHGDVVGVAGDDLEEPILAVHQCLVVYPPGVHLAEPELRALGHEPNRPGAAS